MPSWRKLQLTRESNVISSVGPAAAGGGLLDLHYKQAGSKASNGGILMGRDAG